MYEGYLKLSLIVSLLFLEKNDEHGGAMSMHTGEGHRRHEKILNTRGEMKSKKRGGRDEVVG